MTSLSVRVKKGRWGLSPCEQVVPELRVITDHHSPSGGPRVRHWSSVNLSFLLGDGRTPQEPLGCLGDKAMVTGRVGRCEASSCGPWGLPRPLLVLWADQDLRPSCCRA